MAVACAVGAGLMWYQFGLAWHERPDAAPALDPARRVRHIVAGPCGLFRLPARFHL
jgi:hypothetical protein